MKKYELTQNSIEIDNKTLYQIKALKDFGSVKKGDLGGYIESEKNLSHDRNCWVSGNAQVYEDARVSGNAQVFESARVSGNVQVFENTRVYGNARIFGNAHVYGNAKVYGNALVFDNTWIYGNALVYGNARVYGKAEVSGNAQIYDNAWVCGNTHIFENAHVYGYARLGNVPIDFDCSFDPYKALKEILNCPEIFSVLSGVNKNLDKLISTILTKTGT